MAATSTRKAEGLRPNCLSFPEILAQSIAGATPTAGAAASIPIAFASAGNGTWLAYLIATIGLFFVSLNLNSFARRSSSAGALYTYVAKGLGTRAGLLCGWSLTMGYLVLTVALVAGFAHYTNLVMHEFGFQLPSIVLYALCMGVVWYYAYTDIQLSALLMLLLELVSVGVTLLIAFLVLGKQGFTPDTAQLSIEGVTAGGTFVGFESAATLGDEAKRPKVNIPRALTWSVVSLGIVFTFLAYVEVLGFHSSSTPLNESESPMTVLANLAGMELLGVALTAGIAFSMFACALALINAAARISYALARHNFYPAWMGKAHETNETPSAVVTVFSILVFIGTVVMSLANIPNMTIYAYTATLSTYGFLFTYILICIAAPVYLSQLGRLQSSHIVVSLIAGFFMMIPVVGSIYPVPPFPYNIFPYMFLVYLAVGGLWFWQVNQRSPQTIQGLDRDFQDSDSRLTD
jgi:amino acid transporter